ncbi:MAG: fibronectin type III domain-containing protein [Eubacterium sp.]|nr:fibronectin type III domain-containing protein [Eubacterium sp.]
MKKLSEITALIIAVITAFSMPFSAWAYTSGSIFTSSTYTHQERYSKNNGYALLQGIDVSNHNDTVKWSAVKKAGVDFAVVRIGCRGYAKAGTLMEDTLYKENIEGAFKAGLDVGVYFYSQATTKAEAIEEAQYVIERIKPYRNKITLPVYFDYEFAGVSSGRLDKAWREGTVNKNKMTSFTKAFCNTVINNGFDAGVYASKYFLYDNIDYTQLENSYDIWVAHYATKTDYKGEYSIWQFSSKGKISGINGYVDSNFMYTQNTFDDVVVEKQAYTGEEITPDFRVTYKGEPLRLGYDYYVDSTKNNINYGTASAVIHGISKYAGLKAKTVKFDIVPSAPELPPELTKREAKALSFKWAEHPEAEGYRISCYRGDTLVASTDTAELSGRVEELTGAVNYSVRVCAYRNVGNKRYYGIESEALSAVTKPQIVTGVKDASPGADSVTVKWDKQAGAAGYAVYLRNEEAGRYEKLAEVKTNKYTLTKLKANTKYKVKIKAFTTTETGDTVYGAISALCKAYTAPKAPKLKYAVSKSTKKITSKWSKVTAAKGYQVMWSTTSGFTQNKKSVKVKGVTKTTVKTARSAGSYYVRVRAYTVHNGKTYYSAWSNSIHLYTK